MMITRGARWSRRMLTVLIPLFMSLSLSAQDHPDGTGLPGDHFDLSGALELFKRSESPEAFERMLNEEDNKVNNLDLNGDQETDYIRVIDKREGDVHAFVLQALVSETESQDVAVIEIEKEGRKNATLQIVGDEDIYGEEVIIEPTEKIKTQEGTKTSTTIVNVYTWPAIRYVYTPQYRVWVSPWGWRARPVWWRPWRPVHYHVYYGYHRHHHYHYKAVHGHRTVYAHRMYQPARTTSVTVRTRHRESVEHYRSSTVSRSSNTETHRDKPNYKNQKKTQERTGRKRTPSTKGNTAQKGKPSKRSPRDG